MVDADSDNLFAEQVTRFFNGPVEPGDIPAIESRLASDPAARRLFVQIASIDGLMTEQAIQGKHSISFGADLLDNSTDADPSSLSLDDATVVAAIHEEDLRDESEQSITLPQPVMQNQPSPVATPLLSPMLIVKISSAAAILLITTLLAIWMSRNPGPQNIAIVPPVVPQVDSIRLGAAVRAQWDSTSPALAVGDAVPNQPLYLRSGWVRLDFPTGVTTVIEAPARFQVESGSNVKMDLGRIAAEVPLAGHGFAVDSPSCRVVDLGTEFGLSVGDQGQSEVQVFKGQVSFASKAAQAAAPAQVLSAGDGRRVDPTNQSTVVTIANPDSFVRAEQLSRWVTAAKDSLSDWRVFNEQLSRDPSLMLFYTLDDPNQHTIVNHAARTLGRYDLPNDDAHGPTWTTGRQPGISSLDFDPSKRQYLILPSCPLTRTGQMSGCVWVNVRDYSPYGSIIKNWGNSVAGDFHLGFEQVTHNLEIELDGNLPGGPRISDPGEAPTDRWIHLAFVSDGSILRLYRDGKEVASVPSRPISTDPPVKSMSIGCKTGDDGLTPAAGVAEGFWNGQIGEIALFDRALTAAEISRMSEIGRP